MSSCIRRNWTRNSVPDALSAIAFAPQSDASFHNFAPSSCQSACLVTCPNPLPKTMKPQVGLFLGSIPGRRNTIFSAGTFVWNTREVVTLLHPRVRTCNQLQWASFSLTETLGRESEQYRYRYRCCFHFVTLSFKLVGQLLGSDHFVIAA
jgi:hypothetical protein